MKGRRRSCFLDTSQGYGEVPRMKLLSGASFVRSRTSGGIGVYGDHRFLFFGR